MNAASVLLSLRCEYTRIVLIRKSRTTKQMRFCGLAPCSFMSRSKDMHKDHVLVFILRIATSRSVCYMRLTLTLKQIEGACELSIMRAQSAL